jgi:hypothetical protein
MQTYQKQTQFQGKKEQKKTTLKANPLDKLAHEVTSIEGNNDSISYKAFRNRQIAKAITSKMVLPMLGLKSPLRGSYFRTLRCNSILLQNGNNVSAQYCKNRFCVVCNRIRAGKTISNYLPSVSRLNNLHLVTLTIQSVRGFEIENSYIRMVKSLSRIRRNIAKNYKGNKVIGVRAFECNYNAEKNTFNPHFHLLIDGKENAELIRTLWLSQNKTSNFKAQDVREANANSLIELVKYVAKGVVKDKFYPEAMDAIYRAIRRKKIFESFCLTKFNDNMDSTITTLIDFKKSDIDVWTWDFDVMDWINSKGELFMDRQFNKETLDYLNLIN